MYVLQVTPSRRKDSRKKKIMKELKELEAKLAKEKRKAEKYKKGSIPEDEETSTISQIDKASWRYIEEQLR